MSSVSSELLVPDRIGELPTPAETTQLIGHADLLDRLCRHYATGRMHHAWLLSGPRGIGKATLAFRLAAHILRHPDPKTAPSGYVSPETGDVMESRIAGGGHPNLLHLKRPWDDKQKKFKTEITVDEIRRTVGFFGTTTGEAGWRICIVDAADEMNRNGANALLKILEEPPANTIFLVLSHASGKLLPTIRSRCQVVNVKGLDEQDIIRITSGLGLMDGMDQAQQDLIGKLAGGSVRRALVLLSNDGLALHSRVQNLCSNLHNPDWLEIHALATELAPRGQEEKFRLFMDLIYDFIAGQTELVIRQNGSMSILANWSDLWEKTRQSATVTDAYNLDRKQMILSMFERMRHAA